MGTEASSRKQMPDRVIEMLDEARRAFAEIVARNDALERAVADASAERERLGDEVAALRKELDVQAEERRAIVSRFALVERDQSRLAQDYATIEGQLGALSNLYVASYRLHAALAWMDVVGAIQDIVTNIVGSEESAIFEMIPDGSALNLVASVGVDRARWAHVPIGLGPIGYAVREARVWVAESTKPGGDPHVPTVCIPLRFGEKVTGAIAIFRMLPQKLSFEAHDRELFEMLSTHAANALHAARLYDRRAMTLRP